MTRPGLDRNGVVVEIGDKVRLFDIRPSILKRLTGSEHVDVSSMLETEVTVFDVYEDGQVWVCLYFPRGSGETEVHAIAVDSHAIERVGGEHVGFV
ncbi:hypothetical protein [Ottowia oryzae]|uniref:hypothetical protein n=1 Tax=Ottowia oryzae TaxID=2109914 RepID=UPI000F4DA3D8|nr:hypothetical protein [Ottowia oryzae]